MTTPKEVGPFAGSDPDAERICRRDGGVHQNIAHAVHPDPASGMHCWHRRVRLEKPRPDDRYSDIVVGTHQSFAVYREWPAMTRPPARNDGQRRPLWLNRPLRPGDEAFCKKK